MEILTKVAASAASSYVGAVVVQRAGGRVRRGVRVRPYVAPTCVLACAMSKKKRVNLYLTEDTYNRLKAATARIPGLTPSKVVDMGLTDAVVMVERLVAAVESGDKDAALQALQLGLAEVNERGGVAIHTFRQMVAGKGEAV